MTVINGIIFNPTLSIYYIILSLIGIGSPVVTLQLVAARSLTPWLQIAIM